MTRPGSTRPTIDAQLELPTKMQIEVCAQLWTCLQHNTAPQSRDIYWAIKMMWLKTELMRIVRISICLLAFLVAVHAQDARGTISGRVLDASGSALPNTAVQVTNTATGVVTAARTNEAGNFTAPYLTPGVYTIRVEASGFKQFVQENVQVRTDENVQVNPQLTVGDAKETVTVTAEAPLLSTAEVSMGQVVDTRRIEELPLFAGNALDLVQLAPGTVNGTDMRLRKAPFNNAPSQFSTDGSGNYNNEFTIDGVSNLYSDGTQPRVAFSPPQGSIGEFQGANDSLRFHRRAYAGVRGESEHQRRHESVARRSARMAAPQHVRLAHDFSKPCGAEASDLPGQPVRHIGGWSAGDPSPV